MPSLPCSPCPKFRYRTKLSPNVRANSAHKEKSNASDTTIGFVAHSRSEPRRILSLSTPPGIRASQHDSAEPDPANCLALAGVRLSPRACRTRSQGWKINHKRVLHLMRSDNLLCVRRRKFLFTTNSRHGLPIYPNLVEGLVVTRIDQLWV